MIVAWILVGGELLALSSAALAPPLFVSAFEWLGREQQLGRRRAAAVDRARRPPGSAGSVAVELVGVAWISGTLAIVATLAVMYALATRIPPALAIALIPQILVATDPLRLHARDRRWRGGAADRRVLRARSPRRA